MNDAEVAMVGLIAPVDPMADVTVASAAVVPTFHAEVKVAVLADSAADVADPHTVDEESTPPLVAELGVAIFQELSDEEALAISETIKVEDAIPDVVALCQVFHVSVFFSVVDERDTGNWGSADANAMSEKTEITEVLWIMLKRLEMDKAR